MAALRTALFATLIIFCLSPLSGVDGAPAKKAAKPPIPTNSLSDRLATEVEKDSRNEELSKRQQKGLLKFNNNDFRLYAEGDEPRPYSLILLFTSRQVEKSKPELNLALTRAEFGLVSEAYRQHFAGTPQSGRVFFVEVDYNTAPEAFQKLGLNSVPAIVHIGPFTKRQKDGRPLESDTLKAGFPNVLEMLAGFTADKTNLSPGTIERPNIFNSPAIQLFVLTLLLASGAVVLKLYRGGWLDYRPIWALLALAVVFFALSGGMYNIIRGMPFRTRDHEGRDVFFRQGQGQLGAEGYAMGTLHFGAAGALLAIIYITPAIPSTAPRRAFMWASLLVFFTCLAKVVQIYRWKTGYDMHGYWSHAWTLLG
eukprot:jgi/Mesvir1/5382/Mv25555-RA.1